MPFEFIKYPHIERFNTTEVSGIENGVCYVFPKIDGMSGRIGLIDGKLYIGSRNQLVFSKLISDFLDTDVSNNDVRGFGSYILKNINPYLNYLRKYENRILFGEFLVKHTISGYRKDAWNKFYIFDIFDLTENKFIPYEEYKQDLIDLGIDFITPMAAINSPTFERLLELVNTNTFLMEDGKGVGEGIVIKRYDFVNKYGRSTWAKIVRNEFKENNNKAFATKIQEGGFQVENAITEKYMTAELFEKEKSKIEDFGSKNILQLLGVLYYTIIREEMWEILKEHKNPTIDFKKLQQLIFQKAKTYL